MTQMNNKQLANRTCIVSASSNDPKAPRGIFIVRVVMNASPSLSTISVNSIKNEKLGTSEVIRHYLNNEEESNYLNPNRKSRRPRSALEAKRKSQSFRLTSLSHELSRRTLQSYVLLTKVEEDVNSLKDRVGTEYDFTGFHSKVSSKQTQHMTFRTNIYDLS